MRPVLTHASGRTQCPGSTVTVMRRHPVPGPDYPLRRTGKVSDGSTLASSGFAVPACRLRRVGADRHPRPGSTRERPHLAVRGRTPRATPACRLIEQRSVRNLPTMTTSTERADVEGVLPCAQVSPDRGAGAKAETASLAGRRPLASRPCDHTGRSSTPARGVLRGESSVGRTGRRRVCCSYRRPVRSRRERWRPACSRFVTSIS